MIRYFVRGNEQCIIVDNNLDNVNKRLSAGWVEITEADFIALKRPASLAGEAAEQALKDTINTNLPDWATIDTAITNINSLPDVKVFLRRLSRVVYTHIKNKVD